MQVDYVQAFTKALIEKYLYLKVPVGFQVEDRDNNAYVLKIHSNIHGQNQAGRVWYRYLTKKLLKEIGFTKSDNDEYCFTEYQSFTSSIKMTQ